MAVSATAVNAMNAFVTGGSGFLGGALLKALSGNRAGNTLTNSAGMEINSSLFICMINSTIV
jgi:nucleoside-diphosphate-sugar epimerase